MTETRLSRRARPVLRPWFAVLLLALIAPAAASAQVPTDTTRRDTLQLPIPPEAATPDTVPTAATEPADTSVGPAPNLPVFPHPLPVGWAAAAVLCDRQRRRRQDQYLRVVVERGRDEYADQRRRRRPPHRRQ